MITTSVEYQAFTAGETTRDYHLRVKRGAESHQFTVAIANAAFLSGRVRYQDAPDICYLKLQREIAACGDESLPENAFRMTDEELEEYRVAHAPKTPVRRPGRPPAPAPAEGPGIPEPGR
jgi:hypothetical protein